MKYLAVFLSILVLGGAGLALFGERRGASDEYISRGESFVLSQHLPEDPDGLVLFQFTATWCPPCSQVEPYVRDLIDDHDFVTRRKIDIKSWDSPAARQMHEYFDAMYIPFFALYDSRGEPVAVGGFDQIIHAVERRAR